MDNVSLLRFKDSIISKNIIFFVASGISIRSGILAVPEVINLTCEKVLPHISEREKNYIMTIQPELFYSIVLEASNNKTDVLGVWKCMYPALWDKYKETKYHPVPTLEHYFVVAYSYITGTPVFTTNYDFMLEMACINLGIPYETLVYTDNPERVDFERKRKVFICKIHGDIHNGKKGFDIHGLKTTMESITQKNDKWLKFIYECMDKWDLCFCGYSGRDIDYYPFIRDYRLNHNTNTDIFWLQRYNQDELNKIEKTTIDHAKGLNATIVNGFPSDIFPDILNDVFCAEKEYIDKIEYFVSTIIPSKEENKNRFIEKIKLEYDYYMPEYNQLMWEKFAIVLIYIRTGKIKAARFKLNELYRSRNVQKYPVWIQKKLVEIDMMLCREQCRIYSYRKKAYQLMRLARKSKDIGLVMHAKLQIIGSYHLEILSVDGVSLPPYLRGYVRTIFLIVLYNAWLYEIFVLIKRDESFLKKIQY